MSTSQRKYDVFLSFRGLDTRRNFVSYFYRELARSNIRTFKDDKELESGQTISLELIRSIEQSRFAVVVVSVNYAASTWCLQELVKIMDLENKGLIEVMPIFYGVNPSHVRRQIGVVAKQFKKHKVREDVEKVLSWRQALTSLANISGYCSSKWEDDSEMIDEITDKISKRFLIAKSKRSGRKLEGIDRHMEDLYKLLDLNSTLQKKNVRVFGIWARGGDGRSALTKFVYENISQHFESHCFLESVKRISQDRHMLHLHEEFFEGIQGQSVSSKSMLRNKKVLLVADDVSKLEQLDALAEDFNCFGPGSIVIIATQDKHLLKSFGVTLIYEVDLLKFENDLLRQPAFKRIGELCRQLSFKKRDNSAAFESDVEILCSPRDEFIMLNC